MLPIASLLSILAFPFAASYASVAAVVGWVRRLRRVRSPLPVISVGNLSVGGSGKTPVAIHIARLLQPHHPCILLSRGYGRKGKESLVWWSGELPPPPERYGDEPSLIARKLYNGAIGIANRRATLLPIFAAARPHGVVVLDDGFQHQAVARDLDVVIVDDATANAPMPIPAGRLREWPGALRRADVILATSNHAAAWAKRHTSNASLLLRMNIRFDGIGHWQDQTPMEAAGSAAILVTGIANPQRVATMAEEHGVKIIEWLQFRDHYRYTGEDAERIANLMQQHPSALLLTTEKDAVKLEQFPELRQQLAVMKIRIEIEDEVKFAELIGRVASRATALPDSFR
ncbi:MAG: tetraacyldisaccharide 4'-kinase [Armatimonadetes bacterium]|nr:tetraacyldisaccharide 4'-kinase [Armatimonadota bacterium]